MRGVGQMAPNYTIEMQLMRTHTLSSRALRNLAITLCKAEPVSLVACRSGMAPKVRCPIWSVFAIRPHGELQPIRPLAEATGCSAPCPDTGLLVPGIVFHARKCMIVDRRSSNTYAKEHLLGVR